MPPPPHDLGHAVQSARARARREMCVPLMLEMIADPPPWAKTWMIGRLLRALPYVGPQRSRLMLRAAGIDAKVSLARLDPMQRTRLAEIVARRDKPMIEAA